MNTSGEAADQVMRMMLDGTEVLVKLSGAGAKETALLLYSALKQQNKTSGAARMSSMMRSGKSLKVYTFQDKDLEIFKERAKEYGILFCILKDKEKTDGVFDVLVREDDAARLTRIIERFNFTHINATDIKIKNIKNVEAKNCSKVEEKNSEDMNIEETTEKGQNNSDRVVEELMGMVEIEMAEPENPLVARTEVNPEAKAEPSEPSSKEGVPEPILSPEEAEKAPKGESMSETEKSETVKQDESNHSVLTSDSISSTVNHNGKQSEKKESVRAALERIRQKREEPAKNGETPQVKTKESKGKDGR